MKRALFMGMLFLLSHSVRAQSRWGELVTEGKRLYVQQQYAEAETKYREAMRTPEFTASAKVRTIVLCDLGVVDVNLRRYEEAETLLKACPTARRRGSPRFTAQSSDSRDSECVTSTSAPSGKFLPLIESREPRDSAAIAKRRRTQFHPSFGELGSDPDFLPPPITSEPKTPPGLPPTITRQVERANLTLVATSTRPSSDRAGVRSYGHKDSSCLVAQRLSIPTGLLLRSETIPDNSVVPERL